MERDVVNGKSFMDCADGVREVNAAAHLTAHLQALTLGILGGSSQGNAVQAKVTQFYAPAAAAAAAAGEPAQQAVPTDVTPAPPPSTALLPAAPVAPCGRYYSDIMLNSATSVAQRDLFKHLLQATPAARGVIKFDHCHKPAKLMRMPDTFKTKACVGTAFLLDGIGRVLGWWHVSPMHVRHLAQAGRQSACAHTT